MKKILSAILSIGLVFFSSYAQAQQDDEPKIVISECYNFKMRLHVPRIYSNNNSLGSRKYQSQTINGTMTLCYDKTGQLVDVKFKNFVNKTHKLSNGKHVTYNTLLDSMIYPRFNAIGSNKTKVFKTASVCFSIAAEPNYNIGIMDEDNGLYLVLSGKGKISKGQLKTLSGYAAGTIGCGCKAYGHVSPTRKIGFYGATDDVDDVASVYGTWSARLAK